eukprot:SAG31_NODE_4507_length_3179_cov_1.379221_1_plen_443_part_00
MDIYKAIRISESEREGRECKMCDAPHLSGLMLMHLSHAIHHSVLNIAASASLLLVMARCGSTLWVMVTTAGLLLHQCWRCSRWLKAQRELYPAPVRFSHHLCGTRLCVAVESSIFMDEVKGKGVAGYGWAPYFFGGANHSLLDEAGPVYDQHRRLLHPWVVRVGKRIAAAAATTRLPQPESNRSGHVRLADWIAPHVSSLSGQAMRVPPLPFRKMAGHVWFWIALTTATADIWRPVARASFLCSSYDRELRQCLRESNDPDLCKLRTELGSLSNLVGHIYAVALGSVIPETSIICDILGELAGDSLLQKEVYGWLHECASREEGQSRFRAFIKERCGHYAFFPWGKPREIGDQLYYIDHVKCQAPWGAGRRRCPGAASGLEVVALVCAEVVRNYELTRKPTRKLQRMWLGFHHLVDWCFMANIRVIPRLCHTASCRKNGQHP